MNNLIIARKTTVNFSKTKTDNSFKISINSGQFCFYNSIVKTMNLHDNDAVMFAFNKQLKEGYIFKEEPAADNYILKKHCRPYLRFSNKKLIDDYFIDIFELKDNNSYYFEIENTANNKGWFKFELKNTSIKKVDNKNCSKEAICEDFINIGRACCQRCLKKDPI